MNFVINLGCLAGKPADLEQLDNSFKERYGLQGFVNSTVEIGCAHTSAPLGAPLARQLGSSVLMHVPCVDHSCFAVISTGFKIPIDQRQPPRIVHCCR